MFAVILLGIYVTLMAFGYVSYLLTLSQPTTPVTPASGMKTLWLSLWLIVFLAVVVVDYHKTPGVWQLGVLLVALQIMGGFSTAASVGKPSQRRSLDDKIIGVVRGTAGMGSSLALFVLVFGSYLGLWA